MDRFKLTDYLWNESRDLFNESLKTTFIQGIREKNLDPQFFAKYIIQDAAYLFDLEHIFRELLTKAKNENTAGDEELLEFLENYHAEMLEYNQYFMRKFGINEAKAVKNIKSFQDCHDRKMSILKEMDVIYSLIAKLSCYKLWPEISRSITDCQEGNIYGFWIVDSSSQSALEALQALEDIINKYAHRVDKTEALKVFRNFMQAEIDMFNLVDS